MQSSKPEEELLSYETVGRDHGFVPFSEAMDEHRNCRMTKFLQIIEERYMRRVISPLEETPGLLRGFLNEVGEFVDGAEPPADPWQRLAEVMGYVRPPRSMEIPDVFADGRFRDCLVGLRDLIMSVNPEARMPGRHKLFHVLRLSDEGAGMVFIHVTSEVDKPRLLEFFEERGVLIHDSQIARNIVMAPCALSASNSVPIL